MKKMLLSVVLLTAVMAAIIAPQYDGDHPGIFGQEKNVQETL